MSHFLVVEHASRLINKAANAFRSIVHTRQLDARPGSGFVTGNIGVRSGQGGSDFAASVALTKR